MQEVKQRVAGATWMLRSSETVRMAAWIGLLAALASGLAAGLLLVGWSLGNPWVIIGLGAVAAVAERSRVRVSSNIEESISLLPTLFVAVTLGPLAAMVVSAASMLGELRRPYMRWATYTCSRSVTGALTGLAAAGAAGLSSNRFGAIAFATAVGALASQILDALFVAITLRLRHKFDGFEVLRDLGAVSLLAVPLYTPIVALLAVAYEQLSPWILVLFFIPALTAQRLYGLYQEQRRLADDLRYVNKQLARANLSFATALVATLDARDRYTAGHSAAVAIYARDIAARVGLTTQKQQLVHLCGLVHDIGKIGLPAGLLEKPGALTLDERRQMEQHAVIGERILANVEDYAEIAKVVRHHHERMDGHGYPDGLVGDDIPLLSRIVAVADAYNAMTSHRPYREAMPSRVARLRLAQGVEGQFDTMVVAAFEAILAGATEDYRTGVRFDLTFDEEERYPQYHLVAEVA